MNLCSFKGISYFFDLSFQFKFPQSYCKNIAHFSGFLAILMHSSELLGTLWRLFHKDFDNFWQNCFGIALTKPWHMPFLQLVENTHDLCKSVVILTCPFLKPLQKFKKIPAQKAIGCFNKLEFFTLPILIKSYHFKIISISWDSPIKDLEQQEKRFASDCPP